LDGCPANLDVRACGLVDATPAATGVERPRGACPPTERRGLSMIRTRVRGYVAARVLGVEPEHGTTKPGADFPMRAWGWSELLRASRVSGVSRVVGGLKEPRRSSAGSPRRRRARLGLVLAVAVSALCAATAASASAAITAGGSAKQVYATGLPANAQASLLKANGTPVYTHNATPQGGVLFRKVTPGSGYRVRVDSSGEKSGTVTVY